MRLTSATLGPPYFWTTMDIGIRLPQIVSDLSCVSCFTVGTAEAVPYDSRVGRGFSGAAANRLYTERGDDRRVVARPDVLLHRTGRGAGRERLAREDVVEAPADVPLPHIAPRRPPGEQTVVVGIQRAPDVDQTAAQNALDHRALFRQLADGARLSVLRVHVAGRAGDIQIGQHPELAAAGLRQRLKRCRVCIHRFKELHL